MLTDQQQLLPDDVMDIVYEYVGGIYMVNKRSTEIYLKKKYLKVEDKIDYGRIYKYRNWVKTIKMDGCQNYYNDRLRFDEKDFEFPNLKTLEWYVYDYDFEYAELQFGLRCLKLIGKNGSIEEFSLQSYMPFEPYNEILREFKNLKKLRLDSVPLDLKSYCSYKIITSLWISEIKGPTPDLSYPYVTELVINEDASKLNICEYICKVFPNLERLEVPEFQKSEEVNLTNLRKLKSLKLQCSGNLVLPLSLKSIKMNMCRNVTPSNPSTMRYFQQILEHPNISEVSLTVDILNICNLYGEVVESNFLAIRLLLFLKNFKGKCKISFIGGTFKLSNFDLNIRNLTVNLHLYIYYAPKCFRDFDFKETIIRTLDDISKLN